jgi:hypothetical protein
MARISNSATIGSAVAELASRQHGVVARGQLRRLGLSDDAILRWLRDGRIHRVFRGVYSLGLAGPDDLARIAASVHACGPGTIVSHRSAAFLLRIGEQAPAVVDVISARQAGRGIDGIRVHSVRYPGDSERLLIDGIPCTNASRTLVDLAGTYGEMQLRERVEMAAMRKKLDIAAIDAVLATGPKRRGSPCLRRIIDDWRPVAERARYSTVRSLFEARLLPLIAKASLPLPRPNVPVRTAARTLEVDLLWPDHRFIVEADSRKFHATEVAFERDHRRDRELMASGYAVLRVSWREAEREPKAVLAVIRAELAARAGMERGGRPGLRTAAPPPQKI